MAENYDTLSSRIQHDRANDAYLIMQGVCRELENDIRALEDSLKANKNSIGFAELISDKCQELASLQTRMSQTYVDMQRTVSYKFWLDKATPADKKAYPKRSVIVMLGTLGTLVLMILLLLIVDIMKSSKTEEE